MGYRLAIDDSGDVARFIKSSYFSRSELPQALVRLVLVREFWLGVGGPIVVVACAGLMGRWAPFAYGAALVWLLATIVSLLRMGRRHCIGCWHGEELVGGLSLRVHPGRRRFLLEGAVVAPEHRKAGVFVALLAAAFRLAAADETAHMGLWAPAHPASKHVVKTYLGGHTQIPVHHRAFRDGLESLERQLPDDIEMLASHARLTLD